jgi:hypothetical protein
MKKIYIFLIFVAAGLGITACSDFLEIRPVGAVDETALLDKTGIDMTIAGLYSSLLPTGYFEQPVTNYAYGDVMGGSANKGSAFSDQPAFTNLEQYAFTVDNPYFLEKWRSLYNGVFRANVLISMATKIQDQLAALPGEQKDFYTETIAQAHFFRAFWHFEGVKLFGAAIPYIGTDEYKSSVNPQVSNVDESGNYIYIWDKIEADFQYAYDNLPATWTTQFGQVNKWAAAAFLAKVKMYHSSPYNGTNATVNKWAEVKTLLETIIANGVDSKGTKFKLAETYEDLYTAGKSDWTGESIFDVQLAISGTQTNTNAINGSPHIAMSGALGNNGWGFYQPSYDMANSYIVDDAGLPLIDKSYQSKPSLTKVEEGSNNPETDLAVYTDPRIDISMGRFNTPYLDYAIPVSIDGWVRELSNGGPYLNKKNMPKKADKGSTSVVTSAGSTAKNYHLIRYADLLLWYAEALIETGDHAGAHPILNQIRARAANAYIKAADPATMEETTSSYVLDDKVNNKKLDNAAANYRIGLYPESQFTTKEKALEALRFERKIEMALEGHRWYDLARWGIAREELNNFLDYEKKYLGKYKTSTYESKWVTMPIPYNEIITMQGLLVQNENWK